MTRELENESVSPNAGPLREDLNLDSPTRLLRKFAR